MAMYDIQVGIHEGYCKKELFTVYRFMTFEACMKILLNPYPHLLPSTLLLPSQLGK